MPDGSGQEEYDHDWLTHCHASPSPFALGTRRPCFFPQESIDLDRLSHLLSSQVAARDAAKILSLLTWTEAEQYTQRDAKDSSKDEADAPAETEHVGTDEK